ncbi:hypothetical protein [Nocardiopsis composta]|uniref:Lipoprotein n=1 Tax=Nocardiopsis composta TaxID=157465 RepID=A0A7W8QPF0_9ACTN|nr:hypothetical protein [Nocardiopsis composta]MBB5433440.1 hypothetical protein [Nocardiopsis composta]
MDHSRSARTAALAWTVGAVLLAASACGGGQEAGEAGGEKGGKKEDPAAASAEKLGEAQLVQYEDAKVVPEAGQHGTYGELSGVAHTKKLREETELDKPECADATDRWAALPEVREAPASVAVFARGDDTTLSHTLLSLPADTADQALEAAAAPEECSSYKATLKDGSTSSYEVAELDMDQIADGSRAFTVKTEAQGEEVWLYGVVYRNGDHLASTSVIGPDAGKDYAELLKGFTESAVEQEDKVLS